MKPVYRILIETESGYCHEDFDTVEEYRNRLRELRCGIVERTDDPVHPDSNDYSARVIPEYWHRES